MFPGADSHGYCEVTNKQIQCPLSKREVEQSKGITAPLSSSQAPPRTRLSQLLVIFGDRSWVTSAVIATSILRCLGQRESCSVQEHKADVKHDAPLTSHPMQSLGDTVLAKQRLKNGKCSCCQRKGSHTTKTAFRKTPYTWWYHVMHASPWGQSPASACGWDLQEQERKDLIFTDSSKVCRHSPIAAMVCISCSRHVMDAAGMQKIPSWWLEPKPGSSTAPPNRAELWLLPSCYLLGSCVYYISVCRAKFLVQQGSIIQIKTQMFSENCSSREMLCQSHSVKFSKINLLAVERALSNQIKPILL